MVLMFFFLFFGGIKLYFDLFLPIKFIFLFCAPFFRLYFHLDRISLRMAGNDVFDFILFELNFLK